MKSTKNPKTWLVILFLLSIVPTARAEIIYVDAVASTGGDGQTWESAYKYLQDALADADSSTKPIQIWVAQGTYKPDQGGGKTPGDWNAGFQLINDVAIMGGYVGVGAVDPNQRDITLYETILTADIGMPGDDSDNSYHVVIAIGTNDTALLEGLTITAAQGGQAGGGMFNRDSGSTLTNCTFTGNSADYGGAMYNESSSPTLNNCTFTGNLADRGGGMFNYESSSPTLNNCTFTGNSASIGGAIENYDNCNTVITWCTFDNNTSEYGGGMAIYNSNPELTYCNFNANQANRGGGMYNWQGSSPVITDCTFDDNGTVEWHGGGVYNSNSSPVFNRCNFLNNYTWPYLDNATYGAGMYNYNSTTVLNACNFKGNEATDLRYVPFINREGGAIYNYDSHVNMYGCNFEENFAIYKGGAIGNGGSSSSVTATNCKFSKNKTGKEFLTPCRGGAISGSDLVLTNCEFVRNSSYHGGAINGSNLDLRNCTLVQNTAGLGGAIYNGSDLTASNCILWGNTDAGGADESAQIHITGGATFINYCCIQGWTGSLGGVGNIEDNPMFVRDPNDVGDGWGDKTTTININEGLNDDYGTLHLLPGSPCIDAGDNAAVPPDTTDIDADGDTTETIPWDLDGDERFADDPNTPDTGNGIAPIVDIGAYECPKQGFLLSTELLTIPEGATAIFTVSLRLDPHGTFEVTVAKESGDTDITVESGESLVFDSSNYKVPQSVKLRAAEDEDRFDMPALIAVTAQGVVTRHVNVIEIDNEPYRNTIFVDADAPGANTGSSWENAYNALQDTLDKAVSVGLLINHIRITDFEIWVAQGNYKPDQGAQTTPGSRTESFKLLTGVALRGGFAGFGELDPDARDADLYETILSGDLDGNDAGEQDDPSRNENSYHVVVGSYTNPTAILDGFTISGGNASYITSGYWSGGGLYIYKGKPIIKNCKFQHNRTSGFTGGGGGVYCNSANTTITNCNFTQNWVSGNNDGGGAICNYNSGDLVISNCDFNNNSASAYEGGGAVYNNSTGILTISNCTFGNNVSNDDGGAIYTSGSSSTIIDCSFTGNSAEKGGGVYSSGTVINCTFKSNWAELGGGMYNNGTVTNCTFSEHSITTEYTALPGLCGGGMYNTGTVTDCIFIENSLNNITGLLSTGSYGGGIYNAGVSPTVSNCLFIGNSVAAYGQNDHGYGGGLCNSAETPIVTNCKFIANSASHYGGGIANYESSPTIANCALIANTAASNGGGVHNERGCTTTIANCTFAGNSAVYGNALACSSPFSPAYPSTVEIANTILWDGGDEIKNFDGSTITVSYSDVQGGYVGTGNIDSDPLFVDDDNNADPNMWDCHLSPGSPCIDVADNNSVPLDTHDMDGDGSTAEPIPFDRDGRPRISDGDCNGTDIVDMGAYEFTYNYLGDCDQDCDVDMHDFGAFSEHWLQSPCNQENDWCGWTDFNQLNDVDLDDLGILAENWLTGADL